MSTDAPSTADEPLRADVPDITRVRQALERAGYTAVAQDNLLFGAAEAWGTPLEISVARHRVTGYGPLETLIRLIRFHDPIPLTAARAVFEPARVEGLRDAGLLRVDGTEVRCDFAVQEYHGLFLVADRGRSEAGDLNANHVTGVNYTTRTLAAMTPRSPVGSALDLGTGCGAQAFLLANHARRVVATDLNPRCLNLTRFNARLNGIENVECRHGSFFDPVAGEKFDLIVSNPPFVISPETRYVYRDGGLPGDSLVEQIVRELPNHLAPGGFGVVICNWVYTPDGDWAEAPKKWLAGAGCDVFAQLHATEDPISYAAKWLKVQCIGRPEEFPPSLDRWLAAYREMGVRGIATGGLFIRRRADRETTWFLADKLPTHAGGNYSEQIRRIFDVQDFLAGQTPVTLLDTRLRLGGRHVLEEVYDHEPDGYVHRRSRLLLSEPLAFVGDIDPESLRILAACDGLTPLRDLFLSLAERHHVPLEQVAAACLPVLRKLMLMGFLTAGA